MQASRKRHIKSLLSSMIALAVIASACSAERPRVRAPDVMTNSTSDVTIERILSQPLTKGEAGLRQITSEIFRLANYSNAPGTLTGDVVTKGGALTLSDGHRINIVIDYSSAGVLSIGVDKAPCFKLGDAVKITGAKPVSAVSYPYVEGPNYDTYSAIANGVDVNIGKFTAGEECLTEIRLVSVKTAAGFVAENKLELPAKNLPALEPR
jgi:hypothetical protein